MSSTNDSAGTRSPDNPDHLVRDGRVYLVEHRRQVDKDFETDCGSDQETDYETDTDSCSQSSSSTQSETEWETLELGVMVSCSCTPSSSSICTSEKRKAELSTHGPCPKRPRKVPRSLDAAESEVEPWSLE